jgi:hypothetical protein
MNEQPLAVPQSIFKEALHQHPSRQLLLSSAQAGWPHLLAHHYHYSFGHPPLRVPALTEDTIIIHLHGATYLSEKRIYPFQSHSVQPGDIFIVPR